MRASYAPANEREHVGVNLTSVVTGPAKARSTFPTFSRRARVSAARLCGECWVFWVRRNARLTRKRVVLSRSSLFDFEDRESRGGASSHESRAGSASSGVLETCARALACCSRARARARERAGEKKKKKKNAALLESAGELAASAARIGVGQRLNSQSRLIILREVF